MSEITPAVVAAFSDRQLYSMIVSVFAIHPLGQGIFVAVQAM